MRVGWIKHLFPDFEFTWLGEEMRENLPKEMDFVHEKRNAERAMADFENVRTSMYIRTCLESRPTSMLTLPVNSGSEGGEEAHSGHGVHPRRTCRRPGVPVREQHRPEQSRP